MTGTRVVLAEDDVLFREGLASLLNRSGFEVVGLAGDRLQLLDLVRQTTPDLVVTDVGRVPASHTTEGLEAAAVIRNELPGTGILVLSAYADVEHVMELLSTGRGFGCLLLRAASLKWQVSSTRCIASPGAGPSWTPRWCRNW